MMFGRIVLVFTLLGGWVTLGVTPASAGTPPGSYGKSGRISSSVGGPSKPTGFVGTKGKANGGFPTGPHH